MICHSHIIIFYIMRMMMMMSCFSSIASGMCWDSSKLNSWLKYACVVRINKYHKMNNQIVLNFKAVGCFQTTEKSKLNKLLSGKSVQFIFTCWPLFRLLFFPPHNIIVQSHKKRDTNFTRRLTSHYFVKRPGYFYYSFVRAEVTIDKKDHLPWAAL